MKDDDDNGDDVETGADEVDIDELEEGVFVLWRTLRRSLREQMKLQCKCSAGRSFWELWQHCRTHVVRKAASGLLVAPKI